MSLKPDISLLAVGDISFRGRWENNPTDLPLQMILPSLTNHNFVIANLESPLITKSLSAITGKCTLSGSPGWAGILRKCGIDLVTLANNHLMDFGESGLLETLDALDAAGIAHVGAGRNIAEACRPVIQKINGRSVAFLGRSSVEVSSPCYAGIEQPGVALLEEGELVSSIKSIRGQVDTVVLMLHWGIEHYHYPTSQQRLLAKKLVAAGADIILGHHPHVLQGEERLGHALVSYSSGNFLFDEFLWSFTTADGQTHESQLILTAANRQGMMLEIELTKTGELSSQHIFTSISADAKVKLDETEARQREYDKLCKRLHLPCYNFLWKLYSLKREWDLRLKDQLSPGVVVKKIHKLRPRHFKELAVKLKRSSRVSSGKSTNPYE